LIIAVRLTARKDGPLWGKLNKTIIMRPKRKKFKVHLYYRGEINAQTKFTDEIDEARRWVADAEHGEIINEQNINIQ